LRACADDPPELTRRDGSGALALLRASVSARPITNRIPRIQILTVEGLLSGAEHPRLPVIDSTLFRKARREETRSQGDLGL
jgi:hypothetical protein